MAKLPVVAVIAMLLIFALAIIALANGVNGAILASAFTIIGGLGGYAVGRKRSTGANSKPK